MKHGVVVIEQNRMKFLFNFFILFGSAEFRGLFRGKT